MTSAVTPPPPGSLELAITIAAAAHVGQVDKVGVPYILRPLRVMASLALPAARIAAVLHDVVEDSAWTLSMLREAGFGEDVVAGVDAVTRRAEESYEDFVRRASLDPVGRVVKRADLLDNLDTSRLTEVTDKDRERLLKYERALAILDSMG